MTTTSAGVMHLYCQPGQRHALVRPTRGGGDWLRQRGIPAQWTATARGYSVRSERLPDLMAMARIEGWQVHIHNGPPKAVS